MLDAPTRPRALAIELGVCALLVAALGVFALWKMDYLGSATPEHVRMTDNSRSAYVAKNVVEGNGYTTKELPAFLLDFYDQHGKLHSDSWPNADRFPFTTSAIAALMFVTHSTSWELGILGYNLICFVGFFVLLYAIARTLWRDRWTPLATLAFALLHPFAYVYPLYMKDADMLFLSTAVLAASYRYFRAPEKLSWKLAVVLGTVLAWLFLDRPNIGGAFIAYFVAVASLRLWRARGDVGLGIAVRDVVRREGIVAGAIVLWCLPFAIYSLSEWGSVFFSANAIYQEPLGTRFAMETDTWYKYSEPGQHFSLGMLMSEAGGQVLSKLTSSWVMTLKVMIRTYAIELVAGLGMLAWLSRRADADRALIRVAKMLGFVVVLNFALLPLYGYQNYAYRHYLSFCMPLLWLLSGRAIVVLFDAARPVVAKAIDKVRERPGPWLVAALVGVVAWNLGAKAQDENEMFVRTSSFVGAHWLTSAILLAVIVWHRVLLRVPAFPRAVIVVVVLVFARVQPYEEIKSNNLNWFPADKAVWNVLRQAKGLVMSFALQGEVNWVSDRRNIPAPELMMHVYSFLFDHGLEVDDVYIESAATMIGPFDGPFYAAAPGFESYARMEKYQGRLPGYEIVFHSATTKAYPKYGVTRSRPKASTVYRLVNRDAALAMAHSPERIELGSVGDVVYTAYGWGDYYVIDGKPAVAATDATRDRYKISSEGLRPWEDTSVTFFLDDRRPTSVDLEIYAVDTTSLQFYWNLDLYAYDAAEARKAHQLATYPVTAPGWQHIHLDVPRGVTRRGLNKLGFRAGGFRAVTMCPKAFPDATCALFKLTPSDASPVVLHDDHVTESEPLHVSLFAGTLEFHYEDTARPTTH